MWSREGGGRSLERSFVELRVTCGDRNCPRASLLLPVVASLPDAKTLGQIVLGTPLTFAGLRHLASEFLRNPHPTAEPLRLLLDSLITMKSFFTCQPASLPRQAY